MKNNLFNRCLAVLLVIMGLLVETGSAMMMRPPPPPMPPKGENYEEYYASPEHAAEYSAWQEKTAKYTEDREYLESQPELVMANKLYQALDFWIGESIYYHSEATELTDRQKVKFEKMATQIKAAATAFGSNDVDSFNSNMTAYNATTDNAWHYQDEAASKIQALVRGHRGREAAKLEARQAAKREARADTFRDHKLMGRTLATWRQQSIAAKRKSGAGAGAGTSRADTPDSIAKGRVLSLKAGEMFLALINGPLKDKSTKVTNEVFEEIQTQIDKNKLGISPEWLEKLQSATVKTIRSVIKKVIIANW